ncbi:DNA cytosine methyltransferase [Bacillus sp. Bva_UNVM-123]
MIFLDLFAGIGGFRLEMELAGHECIGHIEKDKFGRVCYSSIHGTDLINFMYGHELPLARKIAELE